MTRGPDFDELVGAEPAGDERERLRRTHELLLTAGPPPELPPELEAGPTLAMTLGRRPRRRRHRMAMLLAAAVAVAAVFLCGYVVGNRNSGSVAAARTIQLHGTSAAPAALASLQIEREDAAGNWPMTLEVTGLPALPEGSRYGLYLVRSGKEWEPCGWFAVSGPHAGATVKLSAPYDIHRGDTWVVTRQDAGTHGHGETVLRPTV